MLEAHSSLENSSTVGLIFDHAVNNAERLEGGNNMGLKRNASVLLIFIIVVSATVAFLIENGTLYSPSFPKQIYEPTVPSGEKVVCLVFDDGWKTHVETASILDSYNFTATFAIITSYVGYPAYMNWAEISALANKRNDIVSHTQTHVNLSSVDEKTLQSELLNSQKVLRSKGYAADVSIYPYGEGADNWTVRNFVSQYYAVASTTQSGKCDILSFDRYNVPSYAIYTNTSLTEFASYLNGTQESAITIVYYQKVCEDNSATSVTTQVFQQQMQYLKDQGYITRTMSQEFLKQK